MGKDSREGFRRWWTEQPQFIRTDESFEWKSEYGWQARQPEIDALNEKLESREAQMETVGSIERELRNELARLQAENERLLKYTEWVRNLESSGIASLESFAKAASTPPAQEDEPVAVIDESDDGKFADLTVEGTFLKRGTKLYTRPDNNGLRKDEERYRWLCEQDDGSDIQILNIGKWVKPAMCIALTFQEGKEQIDAYIDAAMKEMK